MSDGDKKREITGDRDVFGYLGCLIAIGIAVALACGGCLHYLQSEFPGRF